jgi:hypothetical protein
MKSKSLDVIKVCKAMVADGDAYGTSEHELVGLIDGYAKQHGTTFAKLFERTDEVGLALRSAVDVCKREQWLSRTATMSKAATLQPRFVGGAAARAVDDPRSALAQLQALVAEQRAQNPTLSEAQAFAQVYTDPKNADLAARERAQNRPTAAW